MAVVRPFDRMGGGAEPREEELVEICSIYVTCKECVAPSSAHYYRATGRRFSAFFACNHAEELLPDRLVVGVIG